MRHPNTEIRERGKIVTWLILLILVAGIVAGFKIGTVYFNHATFEKEIDAMATDAVLKEQFDVPKKVANLAQSYGILIDPKDVKYSLNSKGDQIRIHFSYGKVVDLIVYKYPMILTVDVTKEMTSSKNIIDNVKEDLEGGSRSASERYMDSVKESFK